MRVETQPCSAVSLAGREQELAYLEQVWSAVRAGHGQCVVVAGEAGVGKSRLLAELRARLHQQMVVVVAGRCYEEDVVFPYALLVDALHSLLAEQLSPEIHKLVAPYVGAFERLLPELTRLVADAPAPSARAPQADRRRLCEMLVQCLLDLAAHHNGLLLLAEDLHWSDPTSLEFLQLLARRLVHAPVLLLATFRGEDRSPHLTRWLVRLERERLLHEIVLQPLTRDEVYQMLRAMVDPSRRIRSGLLDLVFAQSQGIPLFVEEIAQSLLDSDASFERDCAHGQQLIQALFVPRSLEEAVSRRIASISPAARSTLELAAAIGQHVDFALLHTLMQIDEGALLTAIKELIAALLLVEESAERYGFRHVLAREAVYVRLLQRERRALHRRIAKAIVELYADDLDAHAADLAYHYAAGEEWEHTLVYAQRAGEQAHALYATYEALVQYTRVLHAARQLGGPPPLPVLLACGKLANTLGDFEQAHSYLLTAVDQAVAASAHHVEWQALFELGSLWMARDYTRSRAYLEQALDVARSLGHLAILARTLNSLGNWYSHQEQPARALDYHQQALGIFQQLSDRHGEAETLRLLGVNSYVFADLVQGSAYCQRALDAFRQLDDRQGLLYSMTHRPPATTIETDVPAPGDPQVILILGEEALRVAREMSWRDGEAEALSSMVQVLRLRGDYSRALPLALRAVATYQEIDSHAGRARSQCCLGQLYLDLLALDAAQELLDQALAAAHDGGMVMFQRIATAALASTLVARGTPADLVRAEGILACALDEQPSAQTRHTRACWAGRAELALAQGSASSALRIVDSLVESTAHIADHGLPGVPRLALLRGTALTVLGRMDEAAAALEAARSGAVAQGHRALLWRIDAQLGRLYLATKRRPDAARACAAACALVGELASGVPHESLRASFQQRALALIPLRPCTTEREVEKQSFYGLTEREREVAALIARGKSNGEIAGLLIMSKRTVEKHVANILGKLGATTRAQIVAWAIAMLLNQSLG